MNSKPCSWAKCGTAEAEGACSEILGGGENNRPDEKRAFYRKSRGESQENGRIETQRMIGGQQGAKKSLKIGAIRAYVV